MHRLSFPKSLLLISFLLPLSACSSRYTDINENAQSPQAVNAIVSLIRLQQIHGHTDPFCNLISDRLLGGHLPTRLKFIPHLTTTATHDSRARSILQILANHDSNPSVRNAAANAAANALTKITLPNLTKSHPPLKNFLTLSLYSHPSAPLNDATHCRVGWITYTPAQLPTLHTRIQSALTANKPDPQLGLFFDQKTPSPTAAVIAALPNTRWKTIQPFEAFLIKSNFTHLARFAINTYNPSETLTPHINHHVPTQKPNSNLTPINIALDAPFTAMSTITSDISGKTANAHDISKTLPTAVKGKPGHPPTKPPSTPIHIAASPDTQWLNLIQLSNQLHWKSNLFYLNTNPIPHNANWFTSAFAESTKKLAQFSAESTKATSVVFVLDASGSQIDTFDYVLSEVMKTMRFMREPQRAQVIIYRDGKDTFAPKGPGNLLLLTDSNKMFMLNWLDHLPGPRGPGNPIPAIEAAVRLKPDFIFILTDNILSTGRHELDREKLLKHITEINKPDKDGRIIKINCIQFFKPDPLNTLEEIAKRNNGKYKRVTKDYFNPN